MNQFMRNYLNLVEINHQLVEENRRLLAKCNNNMTSRAVQEEQQNHAPCCDNFASQEYPENLDDELLQHEISHNGNKKQRHSKNYYNL